jgi:hypothetical protein
VVLRRGSYDSLRQWGRQPHFLGASVGRKAIRLSRLLRLRIYRRQQRRAFEALIRRFAP